MKKETLAQVFSCELCEISRNTFFTEHLRTTASDFKNIYLINRRFFIVDFEDLCNRCVIYLPFFILHLLVNHLLSHGIHASHDIGGCY